MTENHNHRPRRYPSLVWPVILISAGVLFLLDNLNVLDIDLWNLWRLWPLLLILAGIDIIFGRRSALGNILVLVFTLVVVGGVIVVLLTSPDTLGPSSEAGRVETILERVDGVERADLEVNFGAGRLNIDALDDSSSLIQGRLDTGSRRHPVWEINRSGERATMTLEYPSSTMPFRITGWNEGDDWDLHLAPKVGYSLDVNMGAGEAELDLSDLNIRDLTLESGAGRSTVTLPREGNFSARIAGGIGQLVIIIPPEVAVSVQVDRGIGEVSVSGRFEKQDGLYRTADWETNENRVELDIDVGVGQVVLRDA